MDEREQDGPRRLWVGGYTGDGDAAGQGVTQRGVAGTAVSEVERLVPLSNPSWVLPHPGGSTLLAVLEDEPGALVGIAVDDPSAEPSRVGTGHDGPCHATVTDDGRLALLAHYATGFVVAVGLDARGCPVKVTGETDLRGHWTGPGPVPDRQEASHPHQGVVDGDVALVPDLGCDLVHQIHIRADGSLHDLGIPVELPAGFGPRHLVRVDDLAVVVGELASQVAVGRRSPDSPGEWQGVGLTSSLLTPLDGRSTSDESVGNLAAAIRYADPHVVVSNRGVDTVTVFDLDRETGALAPVREIATGGVWPRDVLPDGDLLWVANERSHEVTVVRWRGDDAGAVVARVSTPTPTSVALG